ncbi:MAG: hypothetical protein HPM95_09990 [Alphaproteobacteria bacterium]|nr:hypothetical protein [Alphaproteobacteria bacterium]
MYFALRRSRSADMCSSARVRREMSRVENRVSRAARKSAEGQPMKTLERDPETGRCNKPKD